jgi:hypothetical protein
VTADDVTVAPVVRADDRDRKRRRHRALRAVRTIHMYIGLVLFPWVVFFGLTGMLFNHPGVGEPTSGRPIAAAELSAAGVQTLDPDEVAESIATALRTQGKPFRVDPGYDSGFHGTTGVATGAPGVKLLTIVDLERGRGVVLTRPDRATPDAPFAGEVRLDQVQLDALPSPTSRTWRWRRSSASGCSTTPGGGGTRPTISAPAVSTAGPQTVHRH